MTDCDSVITDQTTTSESHPELDLMMMERQIREWREKSMEAYRAEISCVSRLREEVIHLRALASSQHSLIKALTMDNRKLQKEKHALGEHLQMSMHCSLRKN